MSRPAQFDLALKRPRAIPKPATTPASSLQAAGHVLATGRWRLYRPIERTQAAIAEIEAELRNRGAVINGPPKRYKRTLPFRHNELPRLCLNILRTNGRPAHVREIVARVLSDKGLDPLDRALADARGAPGAGLPAASAAEGHRADDRGVALQGVTVGAGGEISFAPCRG